MRKVTYLEAPEQLATYKKLGFSEVVLASRSFSRYGTIEDKDLAGYIEEARAHGMQVLLQMDRILVGAELDLLLQKWQSLSLPKVDALRLFDPGLLQYFIENESQNLHWITEMGNHNLAGLQHWCEYAGRKLQRLVLCPELTGERIASYRQHLNCELELLVFGRILLFYSPRHLLSPYLNSEEQQKLYASSDLIEIVGHSEESPHKGFPLVESAHGSFMFSPKDLCLLDYYSELSDGRLDALRFDFRPQASANFFTQLDGFFTNPDKISLQAIKQEWCRPLIRGFFKANKSDVLFGNLKNTANLTRENNYLGDVIETKSGSHMVIEVKSQDQALTQGLALEILAPDQRSKQIRANEIKNLAGESIAKASYGQFVMLPHCRGVSAGSRVYWL